MTKKDQQRADQRAYMLPEYLRHWPGLYVREGDKILEAPPEDIAVAKTYPTVKDKGKIVGGKRLTILTKKNRYQINEEVRVIHVMEVLEPGHEMFVMGPKPICGEYVDGHLMTLESAPEEIYDGLVLESPNVDYNYDITSYKFSQPGAHRIYWQIGELRSNTLNLEVVLGDQP